MSGRSEFQERIGVGERQHLFGRHAGTTRTRPVINDDGSSRGQAGGTHTDHWDGRMDATVKPNTLRAQVSRKAVASAAEARRDGGTIAETRVPYSLSSRDT